VDDMLEMIVELLALSGAIILSPIWYFYLYPAMKKEYENKGWTWRRIYDIEVENRRSHKDLTERILTMVKRK
jgi:hypothetical protein